MTGLLSAAVVTALLETLGFGAQPLQCRFPPDAPGDAAIRVTVAPNPSLRDIPGLFRVRVTMNGVDELPGAAQPITHTPGRDAMVRAKGDNETFYTLGFDESGAAALNVLWALPADAPPKQMTRTGMCRNHERYIAQWVE